MGCVVNSSTDVTVNRSKAMHFCRKWTVYVFMMGPKGRCRHGSNSGPPTRDIVVHIKSVGTNKVTSIKQWLYRL